MADNIIYAGVNLLQASLFAGALYRCFGNVKNKKLNILCVLSLIIFMGIGLCAVNFLSGSYTFIGTLLSIFVMEIYVCTVGKNNIIKKLLTPLSLFMINFCLTAAVLFIMGITLVNSSAYAKIISISLVSMADVPLFLLVTKLCNKEFANFSKFYNVVYTAVSVCVALTTLCMTAVIKVADFNLMITLLSLFISTLVAFVNISVSCLLTQTVKNRKTVTLSQCNDLCSDDKINTKKQIDKVAKIRHEINNNLLCIQELLSNQKVNEAKDLCENLLSDIKSTYTPLATKNSLLNAIVNVELQKAAASDVQIALDINDDLTAFGYNSDIVSVIGNLCDNAIEYLADLSKDFRKMRLSVSKSGDYCNITCKNVISTSVLINNPNLQTTKSDALLHGKGRTILNDISNKYDGQFKTFEKNGVFTSSIILKIPTISISA